MKAASYTSLSLSLSVIHVLSILVLSWWSVLRILSFDSGRDDELYCFI